VSRKSPSRLKSIQQAMTAALAVVLVARTVMLTVVVLCQDLRQYADAILVVDVGGVVRCSRQVLQSGRVSVGGDVAQMQAGAQHVIGAVVCAARVIVARGQCRRAVSGASP
jgi:ribosomal protein L17